MSTDITIAHVAQLIHILEQSINRGDCYGYGSKEDYTKRSVDLLVMAENIMDELRGVNDGKEINKHNEDN